MFSDQTVELITWAGVENNAQWLSALLESVKKRQLNMRNVPSDRNKRAQKPFDSKKKGNDDDTGRCGDIKIWCVVLKW